VIASENQNELGLDNVAGIRKRTQRGKGGHRGGARRAGIRAEGGDQEYEYEREYERKKIADAGRRG
jgi:hypothetical protein